MDEPLQNSPVPFPPSFYPSPAFTSPQAPLDLHGRADTLPPLHGSHLGFPHAWPQLRPDMLNGSLSSLATSVSGISSQHSAHPSLTSQHSLPPFRPLSRTETGPSFSLSQSVLGPIPSAAQYHANPLTPPRLPVRPVSVGPIPQTGADYGVQQHQPQPSAQRHFISERVPQPVHVVGQQGRRGILPTAPGRALPGSGRAEQAPAKDETGKFPCMYCHKHYLHAKHLKRHLLRHTGDRPYTCHLCQDKFSRSDILKRHFQKCSQRRGNPSGEDHLAKSGSRHRRKRSSASVTNGHTYTSSNTSQASSVFASSQISLPSLSSDQGPYPQAASPLSTHSSLASGSVTRQSSHPVEDGPSTSEFGFPTEKTEIVSQETVIPSVSVPPSSTLESLLAYHTSESRVSPHSSGIYDFGAPSTTAEVGPGQTIESPGYRRFKFNAQNESARQSNAEGNHISSSFAYGQPPASPAELLERFSHQSGHESANPAQEDNSRTQHAETGNAQSVYYNGVSLSSYADQGDGLNGYDNGTRWSLAVSAAGQDTFLTTCPEPGLMSMGH